MHRHYIPFNKIRHSVITLEDEDSRHLQCILRVQPGDHIEAFDGQGHTREMAVTELGKRSVQLTPVWATRVHPKPSPRVTLFTAAFKPGRMDWLVEKAVELGVWQIIILATERCAIPGVESRDPARWQRLAREALRQSGGVWEPEITCVDFNAARIKVNSFTKRGGVVWFGDLSKNAPPFCEELGRAKTPVEPREEASNDAPEDCAQPGVLEFGWIVGPEGDFTEAEMAALREAGAKGVSLGPRVLRSETAGIFGLCAINCFVDSGRLQSTKVDANRQEKPHA